MRVIKTTVVVGLFAAGGIAVLLGLLWLDHNQETTLPTPTGPFAVGRTQYVWSDPAHSDPLAPPPDAKRCFLSGFGIPQRLDQRPRRPPTTYRLPGGQPLNANLACCLRSF